MDPYLKKGTEEYNYTRPKYVTEINYTKELLQNYETYKPKVELPELETFIEKIHQLHQAFLTVIRNHTLDPNTPGSCLQYLLYEIFTEMPTMKGGLGPKTPTYPETHNDSTSIIGNTYNPTELPNVLIVGGGPVGLYMGIVLTLFNPNLIVHVLENRVKYNYWKWKYTRKFNRPGSFELRLKVVGTEFNVCKAMHGRPNMNFTSEMDMVDSTFGQTLSNHQFWNQSTLNILPNKLIDKITPISVKGVEKYEAKKVEGILAHYAQSIGVSILHSKKSFTKYVNAHTVMIFDATGGRLFKEEETFYVDPKVQAVSGQNNGDGMNMNYLKVKPVNGMNKLFVSIGDSLFRNNYLNGSGIFISFTLCLIIAGYLFPFVQTPINIQLIEAIKTSNIEEIKTLLQNGADLNTQDTYKQALDAAKELPESAQKTQIIELVSATRFKPENLKSKVQTRKKESKGGKRRKKSIKQKLRKRRDRKTKKR
jgi:hypothetical protein